MKIATKDKVSTKTKLLLPIALTLMFWVCWKTLKPEYRELRKLNEALLNLQECRTQNKKIEGLENLLNKKSEYFVAYRGYWQGLGAAKDHIFDQDLAIEIVKFLKRENVKTVLELGCGTGEYAKLIQAEGILISCYDGNPATQDLSEGRCAVVDLSKPLQFSKHDWTISLEVGEHIPKQFETVFFQNLIQANTQGVIISWAVEGQDGRSHVNTRNNDYIRQNIENQGYISDKEIEAILRNSARLGWFKNTIMVFRKNL